MKSVGDPVQRGDVIAEVETDKAVMDLEAFASGILLEQRVKAGELVPVGTVIGSIGAPGEQPAGAPETVTAAPPPPADALIGDVPERVLGEDVPPVAAITAPPAHSHEEQAAPVVRRRARELGVDLALVAGSGPGGRVLLKDLERFAGVSLASGEEPAAPAEPPPVEASSPAEPTAMMLLVRGSIENRKGASEFSSWVMVTLLPVIFNVPWVMTTSPV